MTPPRASLALARDFLANGTTRMRTHVDIDTEIGLAHLHGTMRTRDAMAGCDRACRSSPSRSPA